MIHNDNVFKPQNDQANQCNTKQCVFGEIHKDVIESDLAKWLRALYII